MCETWWRLRGDGETGCGRVCAISKSHMFKCMGTGVSSVSLMETSWPSRYFYARCGFHIYPKHHYFMHFPEQIEKSGVPRVFWVYSDESKNSHLKRLWRVCSKGRSIEKQILLRLHWEKSLSFLVGA